MCLILISSFHFFYFNFQQSQKCILFFLLMFLKNDRVSTPLKRPLDLNDSNNDNFELALNNTHENIIITEDESSCDSTYSSNKNSSPISKRKFQYSWLKEFNWLQYDAIKGQMVCIVCQKHGCRDNKFAEGTSNYRKSALTEHTNSDAHRISIQNSEMSKQTKQTIEKAIDKNAEYLSSLFRTAFYAAKSCTPTESFNSIIQLQIANGIKTLESSNLYQEDCACREMQEIMSKQISKGLVEIINQSPVIAIIIDESNDIVNEKHLTIHVKYINGGEANTSFLTIVELESADAEAVFNKLMLTLKHYNIDCSKIVAFGSDGASTMKGCNNGVAKQLQDNVNKNIIDIHCIAHKFALATNDATSVSPTIKEYENQMRKINQFFNKSSTRLDVLKRFQIEYNEPQLKVPSYTSIRWLSFYDTVKNVRRILQSLCATFKHYLPNKKALELYNILSDYKFLYLTHYLSDILNHLNETSLVFQKPNISFFSSASVIENLKKVIKASYTANSQGGPLLELFLKECVKGKYKSISVLNYSKKTQSSLKAKLKMFSKSILNSIKERFDKISLISNFRSF